MGKFDYTQLTSAQRQTIVNLLVDFLSRARGKEQLKQFLVHLLTPSELIMLGRRLQTAEELVQGSDYDTIRSKLGIGYSTIQSVEGWLQHAVQDYDDIRTRQRREQKQREQHERHLNYRPRHRDPRLLILDLLTEAAAAAVVRYRTAKRNASKP